MYDDKVTILLKVPNCLNKKKGKKDRRNEEAVMGMFDLPQFLQSCALFNFTRACDSFGHQFIFLFKIRPTQSNDEILLLFKSLQLRRMESSPFAEINEKGID
jgi:hypothetical protein